MANTGNTANISIKPADGWVAVTAAASTYMRLRAFPDSCTFYVTSGSSAPAARTTPATGTITITGLPVADETVTVDNSVFVWKASAAGALEVTIGGSAAVAATNLAAKITANEPQVTVVSSSGGVINLAATAVGAAGNSVVLTEASTNVAVSGSGTLSGGTTETVGFRVDDETDFVVDVTQSNNYYVRVINPQPDKATRIDAYYVLS